MSCTNPNCECKTGSYANLNPPRRAGVNEPMTFMPQRTARQAHGKVVYEQNIAGFNIQLRKKSSNNFTVVYGKHTKHGLSYVVYGKHTKHGLSYLDASHELGECIMHALALEGKLD